MDREQFLKNRNQQFFNSGWTYRYEFQQGFTKYFSYDQITRWCHEHGTPGEDYTFAGHSFWFKDQKFYNWFIMRWS